MSVLLGESSNHTTIYEGMRDFIKEFLRLNENQKTRLMDNNSRSHFVICELSKL